MTETAGPTTAPAPPPPPPDHRHEPSRLNQVLAWVGIAAGVVFIVAVVFFSGFALGMHSGGHYGHHGKGMHMFHHRGPGPMGPGGQMPGGQMPGGQMPGPGGPTSLPTTPSPAPRP